MPLFRQPGARTATRLVRAAMLGVDVGGTFTDVVAVRDGRLQVTKVPSVPDDPHRAVIEGARRLGIRGTTVFNHASTKGLNAVITRRLPKIGFLTTVGHRDMLDAGRSVRPLDSQTDARWRRSFGDAAQPLIPRYLRRGVRERILADGRVLMALDENDAREQLELLKRCAVQGVAICLLNAHVEPAHERRLEELVREVLGNIPVSISSDTSPLAKEYTRAVTTVIDVFMKLMYGEYAHRLNEGLQRLGFAGVLNFADCAASLLPWQEALRHPYRIVFAGPAAGTAGCVRLGEAMGERNLIGCDVGGTSTDVSVVMNGEPFLNTTFELEHDLLINALATEVSSVGAGGGSIVSISPSGAVVVGPGSAGANPGPACYDRGGTLPTVTDACLLMGILEPHGFAAGQMELDVERARQAFLSLDCALSLEQRIAFAYRIAVNNIAEEVANVTIRHGADPRDFSLVAFGSAGPMLLATTLELLRVRRIIVPPHPGLFSALGLLSTDLVYSESRSTYLVLDAQSAERIGGIFEDMERRLRERVAATAAAVQVRRTFDGRLLGQTWETPFVDVPDGRITAQTVRTLIQRFHVEYERRYGQRFDHLPVQGVTYRVQIVVATTKHEFRPLVEEPRPHRAKPSGARELRYLTNEPVHADVYQRESLAPGAELRGPAIVAEPLCTILVGPGQLATAGRFGELAIERVG